MELGTRLDLHSFIDVADNLGRHLYRAWPPFHIYVFGPIVLTIMLFFDFKSLSLASWKHVIVCTTFSSYPQRCPHKNSQLIINIIFFHFSLIKKSHPFQNNNSNKILINYDFWFREKWIHIAGKSQKFVSYLNSSYCLIILNPSIAAWTDTLIPTTISFDLSLLLSLIMQRSAKTYRCCIFSERLCFIG